MSKQKDDEPGLGQRMSCPISRKVHRKIPRPCWQVSLSTSQIIHHGLEVWILGTESVYRLY